MRSLIALALLLTACGSSAVSPSPQPGPAPVPIPSPAPAPSRVTITATLTATVSGAPAGTFTTDVDRLPALVSVSAAGYVTRQAYVGSAAPTVDLIRDAAPFSMDFYRQFARNGSEDPTALTPLAVLKTNPSIYLQTDGLSAGDVAALEQTARSLVPLWSSGHLSVATFESGTTLRPDAAGWITVETIRDVADGAACGRSYVGVSAGHIWLNIAPEARDMSRSTGCFRPITHTFGHELGHALGYWHVADPSCLMSVARPLSHNGQPCAAERYHAAIAYSRQSGNRDPDSDAVTSTPLSVRAGVVVVD